MAGSAAPLYPEVRVDLAGIASATAGVVERTCAALADQQAGSFAIRRYRSQADAAPDFGSLMKLTFATVTVIIPGREKSPRIDTADDVALHEVRQQ